MALKLIALEDAAQLVGVSVEELNRLREQREISGYRDGASWKFKEQDLVRLKEKLSEPQDDADSALGQDSEELFDLPVGMIQEDSDTDDVVLLSDLALGESGPGTSSTIIGRPGVQNPEESDIRIVSEEVADPAAKSGISLGAPAPADSGSNLRLVVDEAFDVSPEADTQLRISRGVAPPQSESTGLSSLRLGDEAPIVVDRASTSDISLGDDLALDDLVLGGEAGGSSRSGSKGSKAGDSSLAMSVGDLDDDEMVLGGSDITLGSADSGISLASPSDSGLSLEEPLELKPTEKASLGAADDEVSLAPLQESGEVSSDDDFLLTPMADADAEEDSGSQVIALDSESSFGSDMLGSQPDLGGGMLAEDFGSAVDSGDALGGAAAFDSPALAPAAAGAGMTVAVSREAPYTVWNVVSLGFCALILSLTGLMMFDLMRNMWSWDTPYSLNSSIMDTILGLFES